MCVCVCVYVCVFMCLCLCNDGLVCVMCVSLCACACIRACTSVCEMSHAPKCFVQIPADPSVPHGAQ